MANVKHKINEISKDFALESKKIIALVGEISDEPKKSVSVLTEEELDYIFDRLTATNAVKDFNDYFKTAKPVEEGAEKPAAKKTKKDADKAAAPEKEADKKAEEKKPATASKAKKSKKGKKAPDLSFTSRQIPSHSRKKRRKKISTKPKPRANSAPWIPALRMSTFPSMMKGLKNSALPAMLMTVPPQPSRS